MDRYVFYKENWFNGNIVTLQEIVIYARSFEDAFEAAMREYDSVSLTIPN